MKHWPNRFCAECGKRIPTTRRRDAIYCTQRCQWVTWQRRHRAKVKAISISEDSDYVTRSTTCALCGHFHNHGPCDLAGEGCQCTEVKG